MPVERVKRRLPDWITGAEVSELAYRIVVSAFETLEHPPDRADPSMTLPHIYVGEIVGHLCRRLDADEADVLRALAELERVGALKTERTHA